MHIWVLQSWELVELPAQGAPPWAGAGLVQVLSLCCIPPPQVTEQVFQDPQVAQLPSTEKDWKIHVTKQYIFSWICGLFGGLLVYQLLTRTWLSVAVLWGVRTSGAGSSTILRSRVCAGSLPVLSTSATRHCTRAPVPPVCPHSIDLTSKTK